MAYTPGSPIEANDYNTFATFVGGMNEIFADLNPGATTMPTASYGYGQSPALTPVAAGQPVLATDWAALFQSMRNCGTHQGTTVVPPLPPSNPTAGNQIEVYNTPTTVAALIDTLRNNRFNVAALQSTLTTGDNQVQPGSLVPWTNTLTFTYQVNFGSWDNARYFFNSGGSLNLNASYTPTPTPQDVQWANLLSEMSPLRFRAVDVVPNSGGNSGTGQGFYGLTTTYQSVYQRAFGGSGYYSASFVRLEARYAAAAGINGLVDFRVSLVDDDTNPPSDPKVGVTTFRIDNVRATGVVSYGGPAVTVTPVGGTNGFVRT